MWLCLCGCQHTACTCMQKMCVCVFCLCFCICSDSELPDAMDKGAPVFLIGVSRGSINRNSCFPYPWMTNTLAKNPLNPYIWQYRRALLYWYSLLCFSLGQNSACLKVKKQACISTWYTHGFLQHCREIILLTIETVMQLCTVYDPPKQRTTDSHILWSIVWHSQVAKSDVKLSTVKPRYTNTPVRGFRIRRPGRSECMSWVTK